MTQSLAHDFDGNDLTPENRSTCRDRETVQVWMKGEQDEQAEAVRG